MSLLPNQNFHRLSSFMMSLKVQCQKKPSWWKVMFWPSLTWSWPWLTTTSPRCEGAESRGQRAMDNCCTASEITIFKNRLQTNTSIYGWTHHAICVFRCTLQKECQGQIGMEWIRIIAWTTVDQSMINS